MGEIKPLGSEKLAGNEKLRRILELTYYNQNKNITESTQKAEILKESTTGVYGIVKEKDGYYVKHGINESSLDYIGGLFMKNKNRFNSYAEALKRMELISSPEALNEEKKYVLKNPNAAPPMAAEAPAAAPAVPDVSTAPAAPSAPAPSSDSADTVPAAPTSSDDDMPTPPSDDASMDDSEPTNEPTGEEGDETGPEHMKEIQRLCGKLGQAIREVKDKMEGDDVKYVINMILSAVDIDKLEEADKEEMAKKFEPEEGEEPTGEEPAPENGDETGEEGGEETSPAPEPGANPMGKDSDMDENMSKLEELINTKFDDGHQSDMDEWFFDDKDHKSDDSHNTIEKHSKVGGEDKPHRLATSSKLGHWLNDKHKKYDDFDGSDYDEEDFDDHDTYMDKHADSGWDLYDKDTFDRHKPVKIRTLRKNEGLDISPELNGAINEAINNTLSKYFE